MWWASILIERAVGAPVEAFDQHVVRRAAGQHDLELGIVRAREVVVEIDLHAVAVEDADRDVPSAGIRPEVARTVTNAAGAPRPGTGTSSTRCPACSSSGPGAGPGGSC